MSLLGNSTTKPKHYTLGSLWCLLSSLNLKNSGEILQRFDQVGVPQVGLNEKREIVSYFTGIKNNSELIDIQKRTDTLINRNDL
jgi:hypothetical protein